MLYYIPLEILPMRYTEMQDRVTRKAFNDANINFVTINGEELSAKLGKDQFLNPYSTNYFKFSQLMKICEMFNNGEIKDGDSFYFSDLWFPGIESIKYMAYFIGIKIKIFGIMHAGSFTPTDTVNGMKEWANPFELSIIKASDIIFVGSEQTRQDMITAFPLEYEDLNKIKVTGLAYDFNEVVKYDDPTVKKENIIIFPHRLHAEKQPELCKSLEKYFPNCTFIYTHEHNYSKEEYYKLLAKSKILFCASLQENFGYSVLEGCTLGVMPVMPLNNTCYKYMYPKELLYSTVDEAIKLMKKIVDDGYYIDLDNIPFYYHDSLKRQTKIIKELTK
jgi:hypothetical protein